MPLTSVTKDPQALTMTIVADFPVPQRALWEAYADPRQLEKFWGPPEWPATFLRHDMFPGGRSTYVMRGPDGATSAGYWTFLEVEAPHRFSVLDGFAGGDGEPNPDMPTMRMEFTFEETPTGSRLTSTTHFNSAEELDELLAMGMEEGTRSAMGQIDAILSDLREFAAGIETRSRVLSQTQVRFTRVIGGPPRDVWRAHHDPALLKRWLLGPDGWRMVTCEVAAGVGDSFRYEWEREGGGERFGFDGDLLESDPPHRSVTTERMTGAASPETLNEMTLTPVTAGTLLSLVVTYPDAGTRDEILATGMTEGMEASYARLEREVLSPA